MVVGTGWRRAGSSGRAVGRGRVLPARTRRRPTIAAKEAPMQTPNSRDKPTEGETTPVQGETQKPSSRQPHERDESASSQQAGEPSMQRIGEIAHADMAQGQVDTDRGPVLDAAYDKVREGASQPVKQ